MPLNEKVKHTPGPWGVSGSRDTDLEIRQIASDGMIAIVEQTLGYAEADEANARLIAAAPELAEALRSLLADAENFELHLGKKRAVMIRAALKKAGIE